MVTMCIDWTATSAIGATVSAAIACFSFVIATISLSFAYKEYRKRLKFEQCDVIMRYNERYENSESIKRVVDFLTKKYKGEEVETEKLPSIYDKEIFLRFFEELNYMIDCGYLEKDIIADTFAFYFLVAWNDDTLFWDAEMYAPAESMKEAQNSPSWNNAKSFYKKMKSYEKEEVQKFLKQLKTNNNTN